MRALDPDATHEVRERTVWVVKAKGAPLELRRAFCTYNDAQAVAPAKTGCVDVYSGEDLSANLATTRVKVNARGSIIDKVETEVKVGDEVR